MAKGRGREGNQKKKRKKKREESEREGWFKSSFLFYFPFLFFIESE